MLTHRLGRRGRVLVAVLFFPAVVASSALVAPSLAGAAALSVGSPARLAAQSQVSEVFNDINAIRQHFHLVTGTRTTVYQAVVQTAAADLHDPALGAIPAGLIRQYGVWGAESSGNGAQLEATDLVNTWVYNDGWEGSATMNVDCTSPSAPGCNDHRRYILSSPPAKGSKLTIDVAVVSTTVGSSPAVSVAAVLSWSA